MHCARASNMPLQSIPRDGSLPGRMCYSAVRQVVEDGKGKAVQGRKDMHCACASNMPLQSIPARRFASRMHVLLGVRQAVEDGKGKSVQAGNGRGGPRQPHRKLVRRRHKERSTAGAGLRRAPAAMHVLALRRAPAAMHVLALFPCSLLQGRNWVGVFDPRSQLVATGKGGCL